MKTSLGNGNNEIYVRDLMSTGPISVGPYASLKDAMDLMEWRRIRHVPVVDGDGNLLGLISHRDCLNIAFSELSEVNEEDAKEIYETIPVGEVMKSELITITPYAPLKNAAQVLFENKIGCLPVVEKDKLIGIITESDFVKAVAQWPTLQVLSSTVDDTRAELLA